jgi:filamentous hemagglutinin family protein
MSLGNTDMRLQHFQRRFFAASRTALAYTVSTCLVFQPFMLHAQQIVTDGRTQTTLSVNGAVTNVTTATIANGNAFNSFSKFDVNTGNTVNLYVPDGADRLVNVVRDRQTSIDGILNSYKSGEIGGDVYFLNPNGIVVGEKGVVNTGRLTLSTPTAEFADDLVNSQGAISHARVDQMVRGEVPLSQNGSVRILGAVNARDQLIIRSASQQISGTVREGAEASRAIFDNLVNTDGLQKGAASVAVAADGTISLLGAGQAAPVAQRQMVVVDRSAETRTETSLTIREGLVDISTTSINGNNAYNSFSIFDVYEGQTVNLIVPSSVSNLINIVRDKQSDINGQLNALKDGQIGGNVFFLNPYGVVVGASGIIRADSVTLAAPSLEDIDRLVKTKTAPDQNDALALLSLGALQKNTKGIVNVNGVIEAKSGITVAGQDVGISGRLTVEGTGAAGIAPQIVVQSVNDTVINGGQIVAEGGNGRNGGTIKVTAGNDVTVNAGSLISASGRGAGSDAGSVVIFADNEATLGPGASVLALGGDVSGNGGFIEFSGRKVVNLAGGTLDAAAFFGKGGEVLIDPEQIVISANTCLGCSSAYSAALSAGTAFSLQASQSITLAENVFLSTRQVGGATDRISHATAASTGNSGNVTLTAPDIELKSGSAIYAHATGSYASADVKLAGSSILLDKATVTGRNITLDARDEQVDSVAFVLQVGTAESDVTIRNGSRISADGALTVKAIASSVVADLATNVNRPYLLSSANTASASITIDNASLTAGGDVTVEANAKTVSLASDLLTDSILPLPIPFDAAVGVALSSATVDVTGGSNIESTDGSISLVADSRAEVEAIATARNITFGQASLPYAAAISVGVITNTARVAVDNSTLKAKNDVDVHAYALSENNNTFDVLGGGSTSGALGIGFNFTDHTAQTRVRNSNVTAETGDINVLTDSILRAEQAGTLSVKDSATDNVLDLIDSVVAAVVDEFFTEDGKETDTGEKITTYWGITKDAATGIDALASVYSAAWGEKSGISGKRQEGKDSVWGASAGVLIALDDSSAEISAGSGKSVTIDTAGALSVESRSNALTMNSVATEVAYDGESGTATALSLNLSYENMSNTAFIAGDTATGAITVNAESASVKATQFETVDVSEDEQTLTFRDDEMSADRYANGRSIIANARSAAPGATANTYAIGIGVSTRDVAAYVDNASLKLAADGALVIGAENVLSVLYMEAGDAEDMAVLAAEAATGRLSDQLSEIRDAKAAAKAQAEEDARTAATPAEKAQAEQQVAAADADLNKVEAQQEQVDTTKTQAETAAANPVATLGSTYTVGFNLSTQNTKAELRGGASLGSLVSGGGTLSGQVGSIDVSAHSGLEGGLSTYATLNGGNAQKGSSGTALNIGVNVLLGETVAKIAERSTSTGGSDVLNTLYSSGDVSVTARNETTFKIVNKSATPEKMSGDATSANLITLSGGIQMLDTTAKLERSIFADGDLTVGAASANAIATYLIGTTAGGAVAPVSNAVTNGLDLIAQIAGYDLGDEEPEDGEPPAEEEDEDDATKSASLGIGAILNLGLVAGALSKSAAMAESAQKAMAAEQDAQNVMKEQGKKDFVLSAGFSFNSFDSVAETAAGLTLSAEGVSVGAYNVTDADVSVTSNSEFDEGAGATVLSLAANLANQDNRALVGANSTIIVGANGLTVEAATKAWTEDENGDESLEEGSSDFFARSIGKSGLKGKQLILALGLNIVDFENEAKIDNNVTILSQAAYAAADQQALSGVIASDGDKPNVTVSSLGITTLKAEGNAANGTNGMFFAGEDGLLSYYEDTKDMRGGALGLSIAKMASPLITGYLDSRVKQRQSELTEAPGAGGDGDAKGFGVAINVGSIDVHSSIGNGNAIVDAADVMVSADAQVRSSAQGVAGTGPSGEILSLSPEASETATTAFDAAAAINVVYGDVSAGIGTGRAVTLRAADLEENLGALTSDGVISAGSLTVSAKTQAMAEATSDGKAAGASAADGASGALNLHDFDTTATLASSVRATGDVAVTATSDTVEVVNAEASARGTPVEAYASKLKVSTNSMLGESGGGNSNTGIFGRAADRFATTYKQISAETDKMKDSKPTQAFAAAVGFNYADHDTKAVIADNVRIETEGAIHILADHDAMSMAQVSGAAVLSDDATGAAMSINVINNTVQAIVGNNVVLGSADAKASDVSVQAMSRFNTGVNVADLLQYKTDEDGNYVLENGEKVLDETFPDFNYAAEAIAGAGGKGSSLTGAFAATVYLGDTSTTLGNNVSVATTGDATIGSYDQSQLANKAWGVSVALGTGTSVTKSARGAVGSVIYRGRDVETTIGSDFHLSADGAADIVAKVLMPSEAWVGPEQGSITSSTTWLDYVDPVLGGDIAAPLRNGDAEVTQSLHNQVIAAAAAGQSTSASYSGALGITVANGNTKVSIGERANVSADTINIESRMNQEILGIGGSLTVSLSGSGGTFGAQAAVNVVMDEVLTSIGKGGTFVATGDGVNVSAEAETQAMTITAVASLSGSTSTTVAANISSNTFESSAKTDIKGNVSITAEGDVNVTARNQIDAFAFAGALGVSFGTSNPVAATLVSNVQMSAAQALLGSGSSIISNEGSVNLGAETDERLLSIPVAGGGLAGVLSVTVVDSTTRAIADATSTLSAEKGNVSVTAENSSDVLEIAGTIAFSMSGAAFGLTMPGTGVNKTVEAQIGNAVARNIEVAARAENDIRQLAGAGAASTASAGAAGTVSVLVLDNNVTARIAQNATVTANGNIWVDAADDSSLLQFGGGIGAGSSVGVGASVGTIVVLGETLAEVGKNATVTARGLESDVVSYEELADAGNAVESQRTGIVGSFEALEDTGLAFADDVEAAFNTLGDIGKSKAARDSLLAIDSTTKTAKGFVMTANGDHRAVAISLAVGASTGAVGVGGVVDVGVFSNTVGAHVNAGASINAALSAANLADYGANQDVVISAQSTSRMVGFAGMVGAGSTVGVGGGATVNVFSGTTEASIDAGALVKARRDVSVAARRAQDIGIANFAMGASAGAAGLGAAVNVTVINGTTQARIDGTANAYRNVSLAASEDSRNLEVVGAIGVASTAGIGGAINVIVASSTTAAELGASGAINAMNATNITARARENIGNIIVAGGVGGVAGIGASINVVDSRRGVKAYANGLINQDTAFQSAGSSQDVTVEADSSIDMYRLVGALGGGGTVGAGVSFDMATILNQTDAAIGANARVFAGGDVTVDAASAKNYASNTLAGGAGGVVGVGGAVVINRTGYGNLNDYQGSDGSSSVDGAGAMADVDSILSKVKASSSIANSGNATLDKTVAKANSATASSLSGNSTSVSSLLTTAGYDRTSATIGDNAVVQSGAATSLVANDFSRVYQLAGTVGVGGTVGIGLTVGVNDFSSSAITGIGANARVTSGAALSMAAQNVSVLEAVNFAGAAGLVGVAGSINYNRLTNTAQSLIGSNALVTASQALVSSVNEQNLAATTIGLAGGFVGVGVSYTHADLAGGATTTIGSGATVKTTAGRLDVEAEQRARMSVDGLAGAGGAFAGQAAVSEIEEDSDAAVVIGNNVTLDAAGVLEILAQNNAWTVSNVIGIAFGAVAAGYVQSYADSHGDATVAVGNNHALSGTAVEISALIGELQDVGRLSGAATLSTIAGDRDAVKTAGSAIGLGRGNFHRAETFALAAAGGIGAAQGSNLKSETGNDAIVSLGTGQITARTGDVDISTQNQATLKSQVIGITVGAISLGAHVARSNNYNNSRIVVGSAITAADDIRIEANSDTQATAQSFSISGGAVTAGISLANITDKGATTVEVSSLSAKSAGNDIKATGDILIKSDHNHHFDAKLDSFGVGLYGGGSGRTYYDIEGTSTVTIGNNRSIVSKTYDDQSNGENVQILALNTLAKDLFGSNNINLKAYGAIAVADVNSDVSVKTDTGVSIGSNTDLYSAQDLSVKSMANVSGDDVITIDAAGAGAAASGSSTFSHTGISGDRAKSAVSVGTGASLVAGELLEISAVTDTRMATSGDGSAYGAAATLRVDSITSSLSDNTINIGQNTTIKNYNNVFPGAGEDYVAADDVNALAGDRLVGYRINSNDVSSQVISIIGAAVGIPQDNISRATSDQANTLNIASGAKVQSGENIHAAASDNKRGGAIAYIDVRNYSATSFLTAFMDIKGVGKTTKSGVVNLNGALETGVDRVRYISIDGSDISSVTGQGYNWRKAVSKNGNTWSVDYEAPLGDVILRTGVDHGGLTGTGSITTPRDADLRVVNTSSNALSIEGLSVPYLVGGKLYVNGTQVKQNGSSLVGSVAYSLPTTDATVAVLNTNAAGPDLTVNGAVTNLGGSVTLANIYGSVAVRARVQAADLTILAGRDFRLDSDDDVNLGNDPISELDYLADSYNNTQTSSDSNQTTSSATPQGASGSIEALGNIYIKADGININGLIRSGVSGRDTTVTQAMVDTALSSAQKTRYESTGSEDDRYFQLNDSLGFDPLTATREQLESVSIDDLAEIPLYYDYATGRIVAKNLQAEGGTVIIEGRIASTGRGQVEALDGFARFDITNQSTSAIELRDIDTGDGVEGTIVFNDHNYQTADSSYLQTRWARLGSEIVKYENTSSELTNGIAMTQVATGAAAATYDPLANQRYTWTVTADYYETNEFRSHHEDKDDGEGDVNDVFNYRNGRPWTEVSYSWIVDKLTGGGWERAGSSHKDWSAPVYGADPVGSLIVDNSDSSEFRYVRDVTEKSREVQSFESETVCEAEALGICFDYEVRPKMEYRTYLHSDQTYSVKADKTINIGFFGEDTGRISVDSQGDVLIGGTVRNISGETTLTSHQGGIYTATNDGQKGLLIANDITLDAKTSIGLSDTDTFQIEQTGANAIVNASAENIYLQEMAGAMRVGQITVAAAKTATGGDLSLISQGDLDLTPSNMGSLVKGGRILLKSKTGKILTNVAANGIDVDTDAEGGGTLTVLSKDKNAVTIREMSGDLMVDSIDIAGDLSLVVDGDLLNGKSETSDLAERDATFAAFLDARGIGSTDYAQDETDLVDAAKAEQMTAMYHAYWKMRGAGSATTSSSLLRSAAATSTIAAYDQNFVYHVSDEDRAALVTNGFSDADIASYEAQQTAFYHEANTKLGDAAKGSYDANFTYQLTDAERTANVAGLEFDRDAVLSAVNAEVVGGNASASQQSSNIQAASLDIDVTGTIGEQGSNFTLNSSGGKTVSVSDMQKMRTAEVGEVQYQADGSIVVAERNGVSINSDGTVNVNAGENAYLESQGDLNVETISVGDTLQLKTSGSLLNANETGGANATGKNLILSSAGDNLGTADNRFVTDATDDGYVQLRTGGGAYLEEKTGDLRLQDAAGPTLDLVANDGRIIDAFNDAGNEINGDNVSLYARDGIGTDGADLDVTTRVNGSIEFETPGDSYVYAPDLPVRVKEAVIGGLSRIISASEILVEAGKTFSANAIDWYAPGNVLFEANSKVISRSGTAKIVTDGDLTMESGSTLDAMGNAIDITAAGNVVLGNLVSQRAGTDAVVVDAGGSINGNNDGLKDIDLSDPTAVAKLTAHGGIGGDTALSTTLAHLTFTNTDGGNVVIDNDRSMTLEGATVGSGSSITLTTLGNLLTRSVTGVDGDISLQAEHDLTEDAAAVIDAGTGSIDLVAGDDAVIHRVKTAGNGNIAVSAQTGRVDLNNGLSTAEGDITVTAATDLALAALGIVTAAGAGNVSLSAFGGDITQNAAAVVNGGTGSVDLFARDNAILHRIQTAGAGDIGIFTQTGRVDFNDGLSTAEGDITVNAATDLTLAALGNVTAAGAGNVSLDARTGTFTQDKQAVIDGGTGSVDIGANLDAIVQTVRTGGNGAIGIVSRDGNARIDNLLSTAEGAISIDAERNVFIAATSDILAQGAGDITIVTHQDSVIQTQGSWIDSGLGQVRVRGAFNVVLRDVRSSHPSRYRIMATAGNYIDDGGNAHRTLLDRQILAANTNVQAPIYSLPDTERYLGALRALQRAGTSLVVASDVSDIETVTLANGGAIVLGAQN